MEENNFIIFKKPSVRRERIIPKEERKKG